MTTQNQPTHNEWQNLYQAADDFYRAKPWDWMYDNDLFAVEDPESGERFYCCIMGNGGEHYALAAYIGTQGLEGLMQLRKDNLDYEDPDNRFLHNCLMCSFESRADLDKRDRDIIKSLGRKYRGKTAWPNFRCFQSGYFPWYLDDQQCRSLTTVLQQALAVSLACRDQKTILHPPEQSTVFTRVPASDEQDEITWNSTFAKPAPYETFITAFEINDELLLKRLNTLPQKKHFTIEADLFFAPAPVHDRERPYFPTLGALVDHRTGLVLCLEPLPDEDQKDRQFLDLILLFLLDAAKRPGKILVSRNEAYAPIHRALKQIGIPIEKVPKLPGLQQFRRNLQKSF